MRLILRNPRIASNASTCVRCVNSLFLRRYTCIATFCNIPCDRLSGCGFFLVQMAFSVAAPRARNTLPTELKLLRSTNTFRRKLKTFLFQSAYGHKQISLFFDALSVLENFATASRRYTGDIHYSSVVGLFMTPIGQWKRLDRVMVECTCLWHISPL